jgi:hypothetical protein
MSRRVVAIRAMLGLGLVLLVGIFVGCGSDNGPSYYEKEKAFHERGINFLKQHQAKFTEKTYPKYGTAWAIDLHGLSIDNAMLEALKKVGNITELNFSKTGLTDAQLAIVTDRRVGGYLLKLDVSHTAITDAALDHLKDLGLLTDLNLTGTKVTPAAVAAFKKARADDPRFLPLFKNPKIRM